MVFVALGVTLDGPRIHRASHAVLGIEHRDRDVRRYRVLTSSGVPYLNVNRSFLDGDHPRNDLRRVLQARSMRKWGDQA